MVEMIAKRKNNNGTKKNFQLRRRLCVFSFFSLQIILVLLLFANFKFISKTVLITEYPAYSKEQTHSSSSSLQILLSKTYNRLKAVAGIGLDENEAWYALSERMEHLMENPIYKEFKISKELKKEHVNLVLLVSSAPKRIERRNAIRETWWPFCKSTNRVSVRCFFITDKVDPNTPMSKALIQEQKLYRDLKFQNLNSGFVFGKRFLYHLVWAVQKFDFDYVLRMDDDIMLCADRLLQELPMPPLSRYHWGWVHCVPNIVRPEESIIMLSKDIVIKFLNQHPKDMLCHPWADQMIGTWSEQLGMEKFYHHDNRIHHDPPAQFIPEFRRKKNICHSYIAVHGSYPVTMRTLWSHRGPFVYTPSSLTQHAHVCNVSHRYNWQLFSRKWRSEPKRCVDQPEWDLAAHGKSNVSYSGREGT